ncbi:uncharacterized protein LOC125218877 [Salvia hispanica]|uniref:uncharacterized protein LOC125218877 n=1 Tax=Salvia hispanica TaxID=49212 RepID=UPI0020096491|nr:uncharacterized protein LOC125218877 [Salvia hispanica]
MAREEAEQGGWGAGSVVALLVVAMLLLLLPLGMAPGPVQPPSFSLLFVFPLFLAAILFFLFLASQTD